MASRTCLNCMYVNCDPEVWLRCLRVGESLVPRCANHPRWPGQMHDVPGVPCRNYQPKPPEPKGDIRRIPLGRGQYALVDAADYEWLSQWRWTAYGHGYAARQEEGKMIYMHRQIMQAAKGAVVDHIDGIPSHSYRSNLRLCSRAENLLNTGKRAGTTSRFKGVSFCRRTGTWRSVIQFEGRSVNLRTFADEVEAARAYDRAAVERFGVFARPNFPEDWPVERRQAVHAQWLKVSGGRKGPTPRARRTRRPGVKRRGATGVRAVGRKARAVTSKKSARGRRKRATVPRGNAKRR
jgi:hypothetical protein